MAGTGVPGGVLGRVYGADASLAERRAPRREPPGRRALAWVPAAFLMVVAVAAALVLLRAGTEPAPGPGGVPRVPADAAAPYGSPVGPSPAPVAPGAAESAADASPAGSWSLSDLVVVLLPWAVPLVIGGAGLAGGRFADRRGAVAGVLLVGLTGATVTSLLDLLVGSGADGPAGGGRWLGLLYLLRWAFAVQVLVAALMWARLAPPGHRTPLTAALAATLGAAVPLLFAAAGEDVLRPLWHDGAWLQTALPPLALLTALALLPGGHLLVAPGQVRARPDRLASAAVTLLGAGGVIVALTSLLADDPPAALSLWPVVALAGCLVAAGLTGREGGAGSVAGALLAMAVGLAAFPAALFAWDRTAANPGLSVDGPGESVPWLAGLALAGVAGAVLGRRLGAYAVPLAAVGLVVAEVAGPDSGQAHVLAVRCAGAAALGVVFSALRPEAAVAALGLDAACGPVWPDLQAAVAEHDALSLLTERPGGIPVPLLVFAVLAALLGVAAGLTGRQGASAVPGAAAYGAEPALAGGAFHGPEAAAPGGSAPSWPAAAPGGAAVPPQGGSATVVPPQGGPAAAEPAAGTGGPSAGGAPGFAAGLGPGARAGDLRGENGAGPAGPQDGTGTPRV